MDESVKKVRKLLLSAKTPGQMDHLLCGLFTKNEIKNLYQRILIVKGLAKGKTQREVQAELGASFSKISAASKAIHDCHGLFKKLCEKV